MSGYTIKSYEPGFEEEQVKIGEAVAKQWVWPYSFSLQGLKNIYSQPNFDPETVLSCFKGDQMVGYVLTRIGEQEGVIGPGVIREEGVGASLDIPRVLPDHEEVIDLLMERIIEVLKSKNVKFIQTRVSTMKKNSIQMAEKWGFKPHKDFPLGYKLYYHYDLSKGKLEGASEDVEKFKQERDLEECIESVSQSFKMTKEATKEYILEVDSREDLVSHLVIRKSDQLVAYCYAFPNSLKKNIIATFHIEASKEEYLKQLLVKTTNNCIMKDGKYFLVDVIADLLKYESVFISLGFEKVATWGIYEKFI
ncbi:MAG: hypothetical protein ACFFC7_26040 [Candidatus Hermodarchaeota archaeon]